MGCKQSKAAVVNSKTVAASDGAAVKKPSVEAPAAVTPASLGSPDSTAAVRTKRRHSSKLFDAILTKQQTQDVILSSINADTVCYVHPETKSSVLHAALMRYNDSNSTSDDSFDIVTVVEELIRNNPSLVAHKDRNRNIPLTYAIAPEENYELLPASAWRVRCSVVRLIRDSDPEISLQFLQRNNVPFPGIEGGCSPLYRVLQTIPDDYDTLHAPTLEFVHWILKSMRAASDLNGIPHVCVGNASDGDKPLALLYRRFTRQFDLAEKFFAGDNSRPEVVEHRRKFKTAAGNTWKLMELILKEQHQVVAATAPPTVYRTVHRAVQGETPPDLLRYIVETNAQDLTVADEAGYLPLHYAALSRPVCTEDHKTSFPAFYSKYVMDELLYKYPEAASKKNAQGLYPLTLAVQTGKQWIGGGIKSLYDAFPDALEQINLLEHPTLKRALSMDAAMNSDEIEDEGEEKKQDIIRDEQHDAIMLVQQADVDISEVVTSMWAHEEDAGVQMLGCVAIRRLLSQSSSSLNDILKIALSAVSAVVNAMKAHPNEVIVQEKACLALQAMASADGQREISFVASGAVAATVGAMQAHVSDPKVQQEACVALSKVLQFGGADRATIVASVSGLTAIVNAIAAHPEVCGVQVAGCNALKELTEYSSDANLPELPRSQTENLLMHAKQSFPKQCSEVVDVLLSRLSLDD